MSAQLHTRSADRPWLKNRRWASGRIRDKSSSFIFFCVLFSLILNTIAVLATIGVWQDHRQGLALFILPAILLLAGLAMLAWTVRQIRVRMKFGRSVLELETIPGVVGGYMAGTIRVPVRLDAAKGLRLELECVTQVPSYNITDNKRDYKEQNLFEGSQRLGRDLPHDETSTQIPVSFQIPPDAPPTGRLAPRPVFWRLRARASQPGADYDATFIVPVFEVPDAPTAPPKTEAVAAPLRKSQKAVAPADE